MIDIKFRAKAICEYESKLGEWKYGFYKSIRDQHSILVFEESKPSIGWYSYKVDSKTVGQFTTIKDEDGKEIYKGDIIEVYYQCPSGFYEKDITVVEYHKCNFCLRKPNAIFNLWLCASSISYLKKIGNIYDNPELLEAN